ncbi:IS3 family transposase [Gemmata sp. SH-PL17]|uniref:IS3 family transposase n=1 Tax=Gemmata sp. SH-PL17 TaxID=1630693 RepID=UPI0039657489
MRIASGCSKPSRWIKAIETFCRRGRPPPRHRGEPAPPADELRHLRAEIARLQTERDLPKKSQLVGAIEETHAEVKHRFGSPRMTAELKTRGHECSENTVARLMSAHGIRGRITRVAWTSCLTLTVRVCVSGHDGEVNEPYAG